MTVEEVNQVVNELKAQGMTEDEILASFYAMFCDDKLTAQQLEGLTLAMGYELTEEFKALSDEEKKHFGEENEEDADKAAPGVTDKEVEDAKEAENPVDAPKEEPKQEEPKEEPKEQPNEPKEPEESEEERAKKLFGLK